MKKCKNKKCNKEFEEGSLNNPDFCSDDCNYDYHSEQLSDETNIKDEYYIQDTRSFCGNSILWWEKENHGYVCDIRKARVFTKAEAERICKRSAFKRIWIKDYIDSRISHHIDIQHCDIQ